MMDNEAIQIDNCVTALNYPGIDRARVLRYLCDRYGVGNTAPISSTIAMETAREEIRQLEIESARIRVEHDYSEAIWERELDAAHAECEAKVAAERERCAGIASKCFNDEDISDNCVADFVDGYKSSAATIIEKIREGK